MYNNIIMLCGTRVGIFLEIQVQIRIGFPLK